MRRGGVPNMQRRILAVMEAGVVDALNVELCCGRLPPKTEIHLVNLAPEIRLELERFRATAISEVRVRQIMNEPRAFESAKEALDTGFADGTEDRKNGHKSEKDAREQRETFKWRRGPGSPFYEEWCRGHSQGSATLQNLRSELPRYEILNASERAVNSASESGTFSG